MYATVTSLVFALVSLGNTPVLFDKDKDQARTPITHPQPASTSVESVSLATLETRAEWVVWTKEVLAVHNERVGSIWWKSWRSTAMGEAYIDTAKEFERGASDALKRGHKDVYALLTKAAYDYNEIAQFIRLGGRETISDGTGTYTTRIAEKIEKVSSSLLKYEQDNIAAMLAK